MPNHPKTSDWEKYEEVINAGSQGWNPLQRLPVLLQNEYPWMREFKVGFCSETDLALWRTIGWEHLQTKHFEIENFNNAISLRFGLVEDGGVIRYNDNYLMIQPKDFNKRAQDARNQSFEDMYQASITQQGGAPDQDPRKAELDKESFGTMETSRYQNIPKEEPKTEPPKRRGRPPKKK